jgi:aquaporin Z
MLGRTHHRWPPCSRRLCPIAIGLGLTLIHLVGIPLTNLSVNPARSTSPAVFVGGWAIAQLWLFWVALIIGGAPGGVVYAGVFGSGTLNLRLNMLVNVTPSRHA